jgi:multidrug efflux pump subunit AcrA (membrane-fusion protein)
MAALFDAGKGPGVWVVAGQPAKVSWRQVTVQGLDNDGARIAGQFKPGEQIVALGAHLLREGEQVRLADKAGATAGAQP